MKNYTKLLFQRVVVVSLCILVQVAALALGVGVLSEYYRWLRIVLSVFAWLAVIVIVSNRTDPGYKIAWIIPILAFPVFGISFYLLFGGNRLSRRLKRRMHAVRQIHQDNLSQNLDVLRREAAISVDAALQSNYLASCACCPVYENTETTYYGCGEAAFGDMLAAIARAEKYIFLEYFIIHTGKMWDQMLALLRKKAAAGVDVRVIYDDFGCITTLPGRYYKKLEAIGIKACVFNPYIPILSSRLNNRDHRKFLIIDGEVGFTGGVNLADEYINVERRFGYWKDCVIRLRGEAVWSMTVMFLSMWAHIRGWNETVSFYKPPRPPRVSNMPHGYVQPFSDSPLDGEPVGVFQPDHEGPAVALHHDAVSRHQRQDDLRTERRRKKRRRHPDHYARDSGQEVRLRRHPGPLRRPAGPGGADLRVYAGLHPLEGVLRGRGVRRGGHGELRFPQPVPPL